MLVHLWGGTGVSAGGGGDTRLGEGKMRASREKAGNEHSGRGLSVRWGRGVRSAVTYSVVKLRTVRHFGCVIVEYCRRLSRAGCPYSDAHISCTVVGRFRTRLSKAKESGLYSCDRSRLTRAFDAGASLRLARFA